MKNTEHQTLGQRHLGVYASVLMLLCAIAWGQGDLVDMMSGAGRIDFARQPQMIGKLFAGTDDYGYFLRLGTANFSPELAYPLVAAYHGGKDVSSGLLGPRWRIPQLESALQGDAWLTPWGEKVVFPDVTHRFRREGEAVYGMNSLRGWKFDYTQGKLNRIASPFQRELVFSYNEKGRPSAVSQKLGQDKPKDFITLNYDADGRLMTLTINGVSITMKYDVQRRFCECRNGELTPHVFGYDESGHLARISVGSYHDDMEFQDGRLVKDVRCQYRRLPDGGVEVTDAQGTSEFHYGDFRLVEKKNGKERRSVKFLPSADPLFPGKRQENVELYGHQRETWSYDSENRLVSRRLKNGNILELARNASGDVEGISQRAKEGASVQPVLKIAYDHRRLPVAYHRLSADGTVYSSVLLLYDERGQLSLVMDKERRIVMNYTPYGYLACTAATPGMVEMLKYDEWNRMKIRSNGVRHQRFEYNSCGLVHQLREYIDKKVIHDYACSYDASGKLVQLADAKGATLKWKYDAQGRCLSFTDGNGHRTTYDYGQDSRLASVTDPLGHILRLSWCEDGLASRVTPTGQMLQCRYNELGLLTEEKALKQDTGQVDRNIHTEYDDIGRFVAYRTDDGFTAKCWYDEWGRCAGRENCNPLTGEVHRILYEYDEFGRETARKSTTVVEGKVTECHVAETQYDTADRRTKLVLRQGRDEQSLGDGEELSWSYDRQGRLSGMMAPGHVITYEYGADGNLVTRVVDGIPTQLRFNPQGTLKSIVTKDIVTKDDAEVLYEYDGDALVGMAVNGYMKSFQYDKNGQLTGVTTGNDRKLLEEYRYDEAGNIVFQKTGGRQLNMEYDDSNQLQRVYGAETKTFDYDAAGRQIRAGDSQIRYGWYNSPVSVEDSAEVHEYAYHADGQLAKADGVPYLWDDLALLKRGGDICVNEPGGQGGAPLTIGRRRLFTDHLGTTLAAFGGSKRRDYERTAFGQRLPLNADDGGDEDFFTGKPLVAGLGHVFLLRQYLAGYGRWSSSDPLGYPDGWNPYVYCGNNVTMLYDPTGGVPVFLLTAAGGALIGAGVQLYANYSAGRPWHEGLAGAVAVGAVEGLVAGLHPVLAAAGAVGFAGGIISNIIAGTPWYQDLWKAVAIGEIGGAVGMLAPMIVNAGLVGGGVLAVNAVGIEAMLQTLIDLWGSDPEIADIMSTYGRYFVIDSITFGLGIGNELLKIINTPAIFEAISGALEIIAHEMGKAIEQMMQKIDDDTSDTEDSQPGDDGGKDPSGFKPMRLIFE